LEERTGDDRPQLPPPSLWPVGFAVGIVCLLVGLIVSWYVAAVGAGLALVFGFLWARDQGLDGVITLDADGQHLPRQIPLFIEHRRATGADLIQFHKARVIAQSP